MHVPTINEAFVNEYLALIEAGATHDEAVAQIAQTNELPGEAVAKEAA